MSDPGSVARLAVAVSGAATVAGVELAALSVHTAAAAGVVLSPGLAWLPLACVTAGTLALAAAAGVRKPEGAVPVVAGLALVALSPVTAFGGSCGSTPSWGVVVFRSGVRVGVVVGECSRFLNGALLVLGGALLVVGLWFAERSVCSLPRAAAAAGAWLLD